MTKMTGMVRVTGVNRGTRMTGMTKMTGMVRVTGVNRGTSMRTVPEETQFVDWDD